jgi:hypothetical protein
MPLSKTIDEAHSQLASNPHKYIHKNYKNKSKTGYKLLFGGSVHYEVSGGLQELDKILMRDLGIKWTS